MAALTARARDRGESRGAEGARSAEGEARVVEGDNDEFAERAARLDRCGHSKSATTVPTLGGQRPGILTVVSTTLRIRQQPGDVAVFLASWRSGPGGEAGWCRTDAAQIERRHPTPEGTEPLEAPHRNTIPSGSTPTPGPTARTRIRPSRGRASGTARSRGVTSPTQTLNVKCPPGARARCRTRPSRRPPTGKRAELHTGKPKRARYGFARRGACRPAKPVLVVTGDDRGSTSTPRADDTPRRRGSPPARRAIRKDLLRAAPSGGVEGGESG